MTTTQIDNQVSEFTERFQLVKEEISKVIVGNDEIIDGTLISLLSKGHVLLEGIPGIGKTKIVATVADVLHLTFSRIQFTPDLMPGDIVGSDVVHESDTGDKHLDFQKGPIFTHILLADEINRATPKTQSALLEAMQERSVTVGTTTHQLQPPFFVLATQNPLEMEGTYPLPEAQVDRFMLKLRIDYPSKEEELAILNANEFTTPQHKANQVITTDTIFQSRKLVDQVYVDDRLKGYIIDIIHATRMPEEHGLNLANYIQFGASPRATIGLTLAAKAWAFLEGRAFVTPQDVKNIGMDVLRHRVIVSYEAEAEEVTSEDVVTRIFDSIPVP